MNAEAKELYVEMLGDFGLSLSGQPVSLGRNAGAKFTSFLQMLILSGDNGLPRQDVVDALFTDENLANVTNSLNNLVYQLRLQLKKAKPSIPCSINKVKNLYYWQSDLPLRTDIQAFSQALSAAGDDPEALTKALTLYRGDLLPGVQGNPVVDAERERLRNAYLAAVARLTARYEEAKDSEALLALYSNAMHATASVDGDLETSLILALLAAGDSRAALRQYDKALRFYQSQGRGHIPERLLACAPKLTAAGASAEPTSLQNQLLDVVKVDARESTEEQDGAFYCNYPSFIDAVKLRRRNLPRDPRPVTLMLLTLVDYEGKALRMEKKQIFYSGELSTAIRSALRVGDSYTRHNETSFLVLLPNADEENAVTIFTRISKRFKESAGSNAAVRYRMLSLNDLD